MKINLQMWGYTWSTQWLLIRWSADTACANTSTTIETGVALTEWRFWKSVQQCMPYESILKVLISWSNDLQCEKSKIESMHSNKFYSTVMCSLRISSAITCKSNTEQTHIWTCMCWCKNIPGSQIGCINPVRQIHVVSSQVPPFRQGSLSQNGPSASQ